MPQLMLKCNNCNNVIPSGLSISPGSSVVLSDNITMCSFCGNSVDIPDGTFLATVNGFVDMLRDSKNPLKDAKEILRGLEANDLSSIPNRDKIEKFLEKNKLKIGIAIAVVTLVINALTQRPETNIHNETFNQQIWLEYNYYIEQKTETSDTSP